MKRDCEEMHSSENDMIIDMPDDEKDQQTPKKLRQNENLKVSDQILKFEDRPSSSGIKWNSVFGHVQPTLVEREGDPGGYSLVSPGYVGKKSHDVVTELQANLDEGMNYTEWRGRNKLDMIGQQMKFLHEKFLDVYQDMRRDAELHRAACNFVKKPGNPYYLYERPSSQKYFSMLSPKDWGGNPPHKFLGCWYLLPDQSFISEEMVDSKYSGLVFLKELYFDKKYMHLE